MEGQLEVGWDPGVHQIGQCLLHDEDTLLGSANHVLARNLTSPCVQDSFGRLSVTDGTHRLQDLALIT